MAFVTSRYWHEGAPFKLIFGLFACKILHFDVRQGVKLEDRNKHINFVLTLCEHHKIATQTGGFIFISSDLFLSAGIFIEILSPFFFLFVKEQHSILIGEYTKHIFLDMIYSSTHCNHAQFLSKINLFTILSLHTDTLRERERSVQ